MTIEQQTALDPKVIDRIQKMLNLARNGGATEGEAQAAMDAAEKTMQKYNLTMAEVEAGGGSAGAGSKRTKHSSKGKAQYEFQQQLMIVCAEVNYCVALKQTNYRNNRPMVGGFLLIGREANVIATRELFDYLNATTERLAFEYVGSDNRQRLSRAAVSFKTGCAERLAERLRYRHDDAIVKQAQEARARNAAPTSGTALAIVMVDYARAEMDANEDARWSLPEGTTARRRQQNRAEGLVYQAARKGLDSATNTDHDYLMAKAYNAATPVAQAHGLDVTKVHAMVEAAVAAYLASQQVSTETPAQKAKREAAEAKANDKFWERARRERERKSARTDWSAKDAGEQAGDTVGLDKQVTDGPPPARRLR